MWGISSNVEIWKNAPACLVRRDIVESRIFMTCPECGHQNPFKAKFCVKCGLEFSHLAGGVTTRLSSDAAEEVSPGEQHPSTSPMQPGAETHEILQKDFLLLVVDDMVDNLVLISLHLQQSGYRVITASNGEEALQVAELSQPDLILMDIGMPELDGLGATRKLREHPQLRNIPVIAVTAFSTDGFRRAAYDAGIDGYLLKPIDFERLNDLIRSLLPVR